MLCEVMGDGYSVITIHYSLFVLYFFFFFFFVRSPSSFRHRYPFCTIPKLIVCQFLPFKNEKWMQNCEMLSDTAKAKQNRTFLKYKMFLLNYPETLFLSIQPLTRWLLLLMLLQFAQNIFFNDFSQIFFFSRAILTFICLRFSPSFAR